MIHKTYPDCFIRKLRQLAGIALLLSQSFASSAHEARPAYLEIMEESIGMLNINWTRPLRDGRALNIHPLFPEKCLGVGPVSAYEMQGLVHEKWKLDCGSGELGGEQVSFSGLNNVISDVLVRFENHRGFRHVKVVDRNNATFIFPDGLTQAKNVGPYYFKLGIKHILSGADHLLFVLGLLLLIQGFWNLVKTITAFTLAHSISLMAAILGYVHVPSTPVEAVIALSIMFLACELLRADSQSFSRRLPWLIAAVFGLVHGLGFAGGLSEIGLPQGDIPLALFMFNIGVEAGQIVFVILALTVLAGVRKFRRTWYVRIETVTSYAIGSIAALWLIERVRGFY